MPLKNGSYGKPGSLAFYRRLDRYCSSGKSSSSSSTASSKSKKAPIRFKQAKPKSKSSKSSSTRTTKTRLPHYGSNVYNAEKILEERWCRGKRQFFIKWAGFPHSANTWEPEKNVINKSLIKEWEEQGGSLSSSGSEEDGNDETEDEEPWKQPTTSSQWVNELESPNSSEKFSRKVSKEEIVPKKEVKVLKSVLKKRKSSEESSKSPKKKKVHFDEAEVKDIPDEKVIDFEDDEGQEAQEGPDPSEVEQIIPRDYSNPEEWARQFLAHNDPGGQYLATPNYPKILIRPEDYALMAKPDEGGPIPLGRVVKPILTTEGYMLELNEYVFNT